MTAQKAEELRRRPPALRSYTQARAVFKRAGFNPIELYSPWTFESVTAGDTVFTVVGRKAGEQ